MTESETLVELERMRMEKENLKLDLEVYKKILTICMYIGMAGFIIILIFYFFM